MFCRNPARVYLYVVMSIFSTKIVKCIFLIKLSCIFCLHTSRRAFYQIFPLCEYSQPVVHVNVRADTHTDVSMPRVPVGWLSGCTPAESHHMCGCSLLRTKVPDDTSSHGCSSLFPDTDPVAFASATSRRSGNESCSPWSHPSQE